MLSKHLKKIDFPVKMRIELPKEENEQPLFSRISTNAFRVFSDKNDKLLNPVSQFSKRLIISVTMLETRCVSSRFFWKQGFRVDELEFIISGLFLLNSPRQKALDGIVT